ncbi:hypothetical protein F5144DRAFT_596178 [Chaetomium tenue]|uniref:Uncharacterized protein n=1 Tax=Chaetomium tenue TaxID=1854479 RepID=A0ACB7NUX0_9PEZI|nr:hypothetical protein F5144DRAFT_596178 [Chaetomium globosum]
MLGQWDKVGGLTTFEEKGQLSTRPEATKVKNAIMTGTISKMSHRNERTNGHARLISQQPSDASFPGSSPVVTPIPNLAQKVQGWPCSRDKLPLQLVKQGRPITGKRAQRVKPNKSNLSQGRTAHAVQTPGGNKPPGTPTGWTGSVIVGSQGIGPDNQRQVKVRSDGWTPFFHPPLLPLLLSERLLPDSKPARLNPGISLLPSLTRVDVRRSGNVTGTGAASPSPDFREDSKASTAHGRVAKVRGGHARITHTAERPRLKRWAAPDSQGAKGNRRSRRRGGVVRDIGPGSQDAREACESR